MIFNEKPMQCEFFDLAPPRVSENDEDYELEFVGSKKSYDANLGYLDRSIDHMKSSLTHKTR
jgi:hypothetical protein